MTARYPAVADAAPQQDEQQIFKGFYGWNDKARLKKFQGADWRRQKEILAAFEDALPCQLGWRLLAFHAAELLSE